MSKELELWRFVSDLLNAGENVILLVVADSSGSSPGRAGYKMAVAADGRLCGSIGGGVMEVKLVEQSRMRLSEPGAAATGFPSGTLAEQVHRRKSKSFSGMICSGEQTVIAFLLDREHRGTARAIAEGLETQTAFSLAITSSTIMFGSPGGGTSSGLVRRGEDFVYQENLGARNRLFIIGGGHCALALSEVMSRLDFHISIFDDRPELNTIGKNRFADEIRIIDTYDAIGDYISAQTDMYVVVMTIGYRNDEIVIRQLIGEDFEYFGVLGSKAKMKMLLNELEKEGIEKWRLARVRTPIGLPINSHTPEEIAVSIAAEIIAVKNRRNREP